MLLYTGTQIEPCILALHGFHIFSSFLLGIDVRKYGSVNRHGVVWIAGQIRREVT